MVCVYGPRGVVAQVRDDSMMVVMMVPSTRGGDVISPSMIIYVDRDRWYLSV